MEWSSLESRHSQAILPYPSFCVLGLEVSVDTHTKLPRTVHMPAFLEFSPEPIAAAHAPSPGGEAAKLPAAAAPPACKETQTKELMVGEAGQGDVVGMGLRVSGKGQAKCDQRER